jgi:hypothetical protein
MNARYKDNAQFLGVYIREAHASDGWWPIINKRAGVDVRQPRTTEERCKVALQCNVVLKMKMPLVVDKIDDKVGLAYSGGPDRLYVIDREGKVAYKGGRGPFGFRPREMEQALVLVLLEEAWKKSPARRAASRP